MPEDVDAWAELGRLIAERREEMQLSKAAAARLAQVSTTTWRAIESGHHPHAETPTLIRIARALRLNPAQVLDAVGRVYYPGPEETPAYRPPSLEFAASSNLWIRPSDVPEADIDDATARFIAYIGSDPMLTPNGRKMLVFLYRMVLEMESNR